MRGIVVEDDVDLPVLRLIGQHAVQETAKVLPLFEFGELRVNLAGADFEGGEQIQRPVTFVSALQPADYFTAVGLHITGGPFDHLDAWFLIHAQYHSVERRGYILPPHTRGLWGKLLFAHHKPTKPPPPKSSLSEQDTPTRTNTPRPLFPSPSPPPPR